MYARPKEKRETKELRFPTLERKDLIFPNSNVPELVYGVYSSFLIVIFFSPDFLEVLKLIFALVHVGK